MEEEKKVENEQQQPGMSPEDIRDRQLKQLESITKGELKLINPIMATGRELKSLKYDLNLTAKEYIEAMDSDLKSVRFTITNTQGMALFARAAAKCKDNQCDVRDIMDGMSGVDAMKAIILAQNFFVLSSRIVM